MADMDADAIKEAVVVEHFDAAESCDDHPARPLTAALVALYEAELLLTECVTCDVTLNGNAPCEPPCRVKELAEAVTAIIEGSEAHGR
jgi:hypothetical protein